MKTTFFKRLAISGLLVWIPLLGFSQALCKRHAVEYSRGLVLIWTTCNNPDSNTWWFQLV